MIIFSFLLNHIGKILFVNYRKFQIDWIFGCWEIGNHFLLGLRQFFIHVWTIFLFQMFGNCWKKKNLKNLKKLYEANQTSSIRYVINVVALYWWKLFLRRIWNYLIASFLLVRIFPSSMIIVKILFILLLFFVQMNWRWKWSNWTTTNTHQLEGRVEPTELRLQIHTFILGGILQPSSNDRLDVSSGRWC